VTEQFLSVRNLTKHYRVGGSPTGSATVKAVSDVSFDIAAGETLGIVGESGCGKTTLSRLVLLAEQASYGSVQYKGQEMIGRPRKELREFRRNVQVVFQDPFSSLNPRMRVSDIIGEPIQTHERVTKAELQERVGSLLNLVGLKPDMGSRFPHQFSGGQRQRIAIARALSTNARLIVLDEPVSALDASIRAHVINLLKDLQDRLGVSYLLIGHDLATVVYISRRIAVMYLGRVVELTDSRTIVKETRHPYTRALFAASLPRHPDEPKEARIVRGEVPSPINPPSGCPYHPRCPLAMDRCSQERPKLREISPGHLAACHLND
jgi:oligopeptide/dipeptide ABC transporter ATP-binding protein